MQDAWQNIEAIIAANSIYHRRRFLRRGRCVCGARHEEDFWRELRIQQSPYQGSSAYRRIGQ